MKKAPTQGAPASGRKTLVALLVARGENQIFVLNLLKHQGREDKMRSGRRFARVLDKHELRFRLTDSVTLTKVNTDNRRRLLPFQSDG